MSLILTYGEISNRRMASGNKREGKGNKQPVRQLKQSERTMNTNELKYHLITTIRCHSVACSPCVAPTGAKKNSADLMIWGMVMPKRKCPFLAWRWSRVQIMASPGSLQVKGDVWETIAWADQVPGSSYHSDIMIMTTIRCILQVCKMHLLVSSRAWEWIAARTGDLKDRASPPYEG